MWVQPPGTPSVGLAYLKVYELTGADDYLDAVRETALALVAGQLESGGWDYRIEFATPEREKYAYRVETPARNKGARNVTTLDDNTTQAALSFLMQADRALGFGDPAIHESVEFALSSLLAAQYPNGAWPQRFTGPPAREKYPIKPASYPEDWPRDYPAKDYRCYYTYNDNTLVDMIELMFLAAAIYEDERVRGSRQVRGRFYLTESDAGTSTGLGEQYNPEMHPAWARKFEPPSLTGAESQQVMESLLRLFELTRDAKYLEPLPRALAYYRRSLLENGQLCGFTNSRQIGRSISPRPTSSRIAMTICRPITGLSRIVGWTPSRRDYAELAATVDSRGKPVKVLRKHQPLALSSKLAARSCG